MVINTTLTVTDEEGSMSTQCISRRHNFQPLGRRRLEGRFDGGHITSDAGLLLVREVAHQMSLFEELASCFDDHRKSSRVKHGLRDLLAQRILGIVAGYEDLNDHDGLRNDLLIAAAVGREDVLVPLASPSTLNRLEHGTDSASGDRYRRIECNEEAVADLFIDLAIDRFTEQPEVIWLDFDATDDAIHGKQEGRFFHGYYKQYCYLPLYVFWDDFPLVARLRRANQDGAAGALDELKRIVERLRQRWPNVPIRVRADSGFARDALFDWCENNAVDYVIGMAKNKRLKAMVADELEVARDLTRLSGKPTRIFKDLTYRTQKSWSRSRRVVAKAEQLVGKANPRFVVTTLSKEQFDAKHVYEDLYAVRGDMENRIKEQQLGLFADRTSAKTMRANQLRLWFSTFAYVLLTELRRRALVGTELARAQATTIRTRLIKLGAVVHQSVRRVYLSMSSSFPMAETFVAALNALNPGSRQPGWV